MLEAYIDCPKCGTSNVEQIVIPFWKLFGIKCRACAYRISPREIRDWAEQQRKDHHATH